MRRSWAWGGLAAGEVGQEGVGAGRARGARFDGHAGDVAQTLGEVEDQAVRGASVRPAEFGRRPVCASAAAAELPPLPPGAGGEQNGEQAEPRPGALALLGARRWAAKLALPLGLGLGGRVAAVLVAAAIDASM